MLGGVALLLLFQLAGDALAAWLKLPMPGNVVGMALLLAALSLGWVKLAWLKQGSDLLLNHMALFFVPPGVGIMLYFDLVSEQWLPLAASTLVSTFLVLAVTGWTEKALDGHDGGEK